MANKIRWLAKASKALLKIDERYQQRIKNKVAELVAFPEVELDIKKLQGQDNQYRLRVGNYRVLFEWIEGEPKIIEIQTVKKRDEQTYH